MASAEPTIDHSTLPRVLYPIVLQPGPQFSSGEEQIALLADSFRQAGSLFLPLFILVNDTADTNIYDARGIPTECLQMTRLKPKTFRRLLHIIDHNRISVIHWNFTSLLQNSYVWALSAARPGLRHWYTDHVSKPSPPPAAPSGLRRAVKNTLLRRYEKTICVSKAIEQFHRDQGRTNGIVTCLHFINTKRFTPNPSIRTELRRRENVDDKQVLLYVGNLIQQKGVDLAITAMRNLPDTTVLWIVGTGIAAAELEALALEYGVSDRVKFYGQQFEVQPFMQAADLLLCPSRWQEAAGFVNLEAQACGLPVVGSRIGGIPEYVIDGKTGLLTIPDNVEDLVLKICTILQDPTLLAYLSSTASSYAALHFSPLAGLPPMLDVYRTSAVRSG